MATNGSSPAPASPIISSSSRAPRTRSATGSPPFSITATNRAGASCAAFPSWGRRSTADTVSSSSKGSMEIAQAYVADREGFGMRLADRESVQIKLGEVAHQIQIGRLLVMHAAWKLDQGDHARKEVSMAKVHVADTLHRAADVAIQLNGARGYSKDT